MLKKILILTAALLPFGLCAASRREAPKPIVGQSQRVLFWEENDSCLMVYFTGGIMRLQPYGWGGVHVRYGAEPETDGNQLTVSPPGATELFGVTFTDEKVIMDTDSLKVLIDIESGHLTFCDKGNRELLGESAGCARRKLVRDSVAPYTSFSIPSGEDIFGWGNPAGADMPISDGGYLLKPAATRANMPVILGKGWGLMWDNASETVLRKDGGEFTLTSARGDNVDYYFFVGDSRENLVNISRALVGLTRNFPIKITQKTPSSDYQPQTQPDREFRQEDFAKVDKPLPFPERFRQAVADKWPAGLPATLEDFASIRWSDDIPTDFSDFAALIAYRLTPESAGLDYKPKKRSVSAADKAYRELYARWAQYNAMSTDFSGFDRTYPGDIPLSNRYKPYGPDMQKVGTGYIQFRYMLLPYTYSFVAEAKRDDYSPARLLVYDFPADESLSGVTDQFMFGPSMMICPVTKAGAVTREVYLPKGSRWVDFWNTSVHDGGENVTVKAPILRMPIFVKTGSIIPTNLKYRDGLKETTPLELVVFGGEDCWFDMYEDNDPDGELLSGDYHVIPMWWDESERSFTVGAVEGTYSREPRKLTVRLKGLDGTRDKVASVIYRGYPVRLRF